MIKLLQILAVPKQNVESNVRNLKYYYGRGLEIMEILWIQVY